MPAHKKYVFLVCTAEMTDSFLSDLLKGIYETEDYGVRNLMLYQSTIGDHDHRPTLSPIKGNFTPMIGKSLEEVHEAIKVKCAESATATQDYIFAVLDDQTLQDKTVCIASKHEHKLLHVRVDYPIVCNALAAWQIGSGSFYEHWLSVQDQEDKVVRYDFSRAHVNRPGTRSQATDAPRKMLRFGG